MANKLWLVTEWIDGGTLKEALTLHRFTEVDVMYVAHELLQALVLLHRRFVVHRDIKCGLLACLLHCSSHAWTRVRCLTLWLAANCAGRGPQTSNVMLSRSGRVVLIDFGLCAEVSEGALSRMVGSPFFVAPEMVQRHPYSFEVDIWSLGITLLQLCNGRLPFGHSPVKSLFMYATVGVPQPWDDAKQWSPALQSLLVDGMLKLAPKERLTAEELLSHPAFRSGARRHPQEVALALGSIWPAQPHAGEAVAVVAAPLVEDVATRQLLDELPAFATEALPSKTNMDDVD